MPFKEKTAWISFLSTIVIWGTYFGYTIVTWWQQPGLVYLVGFIGAVVVQAIVVATAAIISAILAPRDASAASDERDRAISRRAYSVAYPVLIVLVLCVAGGMHLGLTARGMTYGIMAAIITAEVVHYGVQIVGYRMGR